VRAGSNVWKKLVAQTRRILTAHLLLCGDEIIAQLRRMLGLGRKVYWMCEKSHLNNLHFDTRQCNFIDYENVSEARRRLYNRIMAIDW
jgi:hypothetical protein